MKLIINISEEYYDVIRQISEETSTVDMLIIKNGKPLDDELQEIRQEIESNMESIIGKYDSSTPKRDMPSAKIRRNEGRKECLDIIDNHISAWSGKDNEI